jgi:hypothetical protein
MELLLDAMTCLQHRQRVCCVKQMLLAIERAIGAVTISSPSLSLTVLRGACVCRFQAVACNPLIRKQDVAF